MVDARLNGETFHPSSLVLSAPKSIVPGESISENAVVDWLHKALYTSSAKNEDGTGMFRRQGDRLLVYPGRQSFFVSGPEQEGSASIIFSGNRIQAIDDLAHGTALKQYFLEPAVITTLFGPAGSKRLIVTYRDCPPVLVHAAVAAEDRRFFTYPGVNPFRLVEAAITDILADRRLQGGSTITMQLARNFFLTPRRTIKRKLEEIFLALLLEQRLSKEQIFALYANEIYMGQRGSFSIYGFGEAANAYFNKNIRDLTLPEAALLAGMIRGPNLYSPYRDPARARNRRNEVLRLMQENHFVTEAEMARAESAPLGVSQKNVSGSQAPYFVDMVKNDLVAHMPPEELLSRSYRIYTTLDPDLQAAAANAVQSGMTEVDKVLRARGRKPPSKRGPREPQAALIVLDPHTGEIVSAVGGRNYATSQLNHLYALRQPGSTFKPFVYATALGSGVDGSQPLITTATVLPDEPMTLQFGNITYSPHDFKNEYYGQVTVREALAFSLNVATVNLAQMVGYDKIRNLALAAGIDNGIQPTPAVALGAYLVSPIQLAGAYTIFANAGVYEPPSCVLAVKDDSGRTVYQDSAVSRHVLDPRVAYLTLSLMETVIDHGTGADARSRGFTAPAAGKTGTSRDAWFSGFTSNLLAIAWVGYDDNQNLNLTGARAALPIWTDFMIAASKLPRYQDMQPFPPPLGVIAAPIGEKAALATANNPLGTEQDLFIDGTQPVLPNAVSRLASWIGRVLPLGRRKTNVKGDLEPSSTPPASSTPALTSPPGSASTQHTNPASSASQSQPQKQPKSVFKRFLSLFKHHKSKNKKQDQ